MNYTNIPNELWDWQIDNADLPNSTRIMALVIRYTVCFHREWHEISLSFISERTGMLRNNVSRELKSMIQSGTIRERLEGSKRMLSIGYSIKSDNGGVIKNDNTSVIKSDNRDVIKSDNQEINNIKNNNLKNNDQTAFDRWWSLYPRKVSKPNAVKAFQKAIKKVDLDTLIDGLEQYKKHLLKNETEERFIKHPASWLNGEGWNDYPSGPQPKQESNILRIVKNQSEGDERDHEFIRELYKSREQKETRNCVRADRQSV